LPEELGTDQPFEVEVHPTGYHDYLHAWVISDYFGAYDLFRRGEDIFEILAKYLPREKWRKVTMLFALTPDEFERYRLREAMLDALET
jgi:hypothetical protein